MARSITGIDIAVVLLAVGCTYFARRIGQLALPPGPPGIPILGVATKLPKLERWKTFAQWARQYGHQGIMSFHVLGQRMVVLDKLPIAEMLFNSRSALYSDRPFPTMGGLLMEREKSIFMIPYNDRFKKYRKLYQQFFGPGASPQYWVMQQNLSYTTTVRILRDPSSLDSHLRTYTGAVILKAAYGYTASPENDYFIRLAEENMKLATLVVTPGQWVVDSLPFLRFLPSWFPGAKFKRLAAEWRDVLYNQSLEPVAFVKKELAAGTATPSFTSNVIQNPDGTLADDETQDLAVWAAGGLYVAGTDTIVSTLRTLVFILMTHPDLQDRAHKEMDALMEHTGRLPRVEDSVSLPFLESMIKESLRWAPPASMGIPRKTWKDDIVTVGNNTYRIPKGTIIMANIWAMAHDPDVYPEPFVFNPDRYIDGNQPDPAFVWGFGRRVCAGKYIAESTLFIQTALIVATMNISQHPSNAGEQPVPGWTPGMVTHMKPFKFVITQRLHDAIPMLEHDAVTL